MDPNDSAFPASADSSTIDFTNGMSIRVWLTGQALAGLLAGPMGNVKNAVDTEAMGFCAVKLADSALAALNNKELQPQ